MNKNKKIFVFTGKGGVGKSSISCCHGIISARKNIKTLLISIDSQHSLSDIFDLEIGSNFTEVIDNLSVVEFDSFKILEEKFPKIKKFLQDNFRKTDFSKFNYTSSLDMPFIVNILSLIKILDIYENENYENIIVDCPASASTFSYLKFPEMLSWYIERFFGVGKNIVRTLKPISKYKYKINLPDGKTLDEMHNVHLRLLELQKIFKNNEITTVRLVSLPEKIVIEECKRDFSYLNLYDYNVDGIFVNKILQEDDNTFIKNRIQIQEKYKEQIKSIFYSIPIYYIPFIKNDMKNLRDLEELANYFENIDNLLDIKKIDDNQVYIKEHDGYVLKIRIDNLDSVEVQKKAGDIAIKVKDMKRIISLPDILIDSDIDKYERNGENLLIHLKTNDSKEVKV